MDSSTAPGTAADIGSKTEQEQKTGGASIGTACFRTDSAVLWNNTMFIRGINHLRNIRKSSLRYTVKKERKSERCEKSGVNPPVLPAGGIRVVFLRGIEHRGRDTGPIGSHCLFLRCGHRHVGGTDNRRHSRGDYLKITGRDNHANNKNNAAVPFARYGENPVYRQQPDL